ncbi:zf-HC2 domain-containing protein [Spirillospora albida]|uniref:zf-HC2 domain-containing protein n=1 Tax=Spirillospora albida TaxID=58123 RepID=UPI0004C1BDE0|nr:zf-HC2 domain-containing protein [Spirillospora albida]
MNALHTDVGAYALGLLEDADRRAFEAHLPACFTCHEELTVLRGVARTLDGMGPIAEPAGAAPVPPEPAVVTDLLRHRSRRERRGRTVRALAGAAAGLVLLAGAAGTGFTLGDDPDPAAAPPPATASPGRTAPAADGGVEALLAGGDKVSAEDPATGVSGTVAMEGKLWGSKVALRLSRVKGPLRCELVAVDRAGNAHTVAGWTVPPKGYGRPGSPAPLTMMGGTALLPEEIERFEIRTIGGHDTLLTIPA